MKLGFLREFISLGKCVGASSYDWIKSTHVHKMCISAQFSPIVVVVVVVVGVCVCVCEWGGGGGQGPLPNN